MAFFTVHRFGPDSHIGLVESPKRDLPILGEAGLEIVEAPTRIRAWELIGGCPGCSEEAPWSSKNLRLRSQKS